MNLNLNATQAGIELPVKALAGSSKNEVRGISQGRLKVAVTAVAEKGNANQAIIKLLAKELEVSKSQIQLISGMTSSQKKFLISGIELSGLLQQLNRWENR